MVNTLVLNAPSLRWISLEGPDTQDFLHRLTTADVRGLAVGTGCGGCLLTPQGRIRSAFQLWRTGNAEFGLELEAALIDETLAVIDQFTFGEKMTTRLRAEWSATRVLPRSLPPTTPSMTCTREGEVESCAQGDLEFGRALVTLWGPEGAVQEMVLQRWPDSRPTNEDALEKMRILALFPRVGHEITAEANPLEIGLRGWVADNKGCYPGQEVIEKIVALGSPARRLVLLELQGSANTGDLLLIEGGAENGKEAGKITSIAAPDRSLAVLRKTHARENLTLKTNSGALARVIKVLHYE